MPRKSIRKERGAFEKDPGSEIWWIGSHVFCLRLATRNFLLAFERHLGEKKHVGVVPAAM